jgi:hypothetical protein
MQMRPLYLVRLIIGCLCLTSCALQTQLLQTAGNAIAIQGGDEEEDLEIAQNASAFYIKLSESMLRAVPDNVALAESTTATLTQYAYAFVATQAEQVEAQNAKQAFALRTRAAKLYTRAKVHGLKALELQQAGLLNALEKPDLSLAQSLAAKSPYRLRVELTGLAYWSAASWAGAISLSKDSPEVVADLPQVVALAKLAYNAQPNFGNGALASLMGALEMAKAGGSKTQALAYFDLALKTSKRQDPGALVSKAENYALPMADQALFESLLQEALACNPSKNDVATQVMLTRARWLLEHAEDYF